MMQVESNNLLDSFKRSWTLSSQESVQQWVDSLAEDEYHRGSPDDSKSRPKLAETKTEWQSSLTLPESDDGLALGAEAKSFLGVSDFMPISPRLSPLLGFSDATSDNADQVDSKPEIEEQTVFQKVYQPRPPLPIYPSVDSNDTLPSNITTVSSLLLLLEPDPEDMLTSLGFSDTSSTVMAKVPCRFFQSRSCAKGIDTKQFIETIVEDEKDSSSFFTAEEESVSIILGRFRENSIDIDSDGISCRSDGVHSGRSSSQLMTIPDIQIEEVESLPGAFPWFKKLDTLLEENENVISPRSSLCSQDIRPPLIRQSHVSGSQGPSSYYSDEVFNAEEQPTTELDSPDCEPINYFEDDKRVTVKRDTSLLINYSKVSWESLENAEIVRKISDGSSSNPDTSDARSPAVPLNYRVVSQISDASTVVPSSERSTGTIGSMPLGGIFQTSEELVNDVIRGVSSDDGDDDMPLLDASLQLSDADANVQSSGFKSDSGRNFVSSPNSAFDECSTRSRSREASCNDELLRKSPIVMHDERPSTSVATPDAVAVSVSDANVSPSEHGLSSAYLEPSGKSSERHSVLLHAKRRASFAAKTLSIESSGFEDDADPIRLSPVKDVYRRTSSPSNLSETCPLCGSPQSPGWERNISPGLASRLSDNDNRAEKCANRTANSISTTDEADTSSQRRYSQYMRDQLGQLRNDLRRQESVNRLNLDERLEQMRCEILSEVSQFVLSQFDTLNDTLKAKDAEILRLRKQLYEDVSSPHNY